MAANLPVLVEATLAFNVDMLSPDGLEGTHTTRSIDITNHTDTDKCWCFNDGDGLNDFTRSTLGSRTIDFTNNVSHTSFIAKESRQMNGLLSIILREGLDFTAMALCTLLGIESHGSMARSRKLTMRLKERILLSFTFDLMNFRAHVN